MKNILFFFLTFFLIYFKPIYGFFLLFLFMIEYFYIIFFILNIQKTKKTSKYAIIYFKKYDNNFNYINLWLNINKLNAFERVYKLYNKKTVKIKDFFILFVIILFDIPLKIILLLKGILLNNGSTLKEKVIFYYDTLYHRIENLKIEILNKKIYLNCYTIRELVKNIFLLNKNMTSYDCYNLIKLLHCHSKRFNSFEQSLDQKVMFYMSNITTIENKKIPFFHPTYVWPIKLNRYMGEDNNFSIHSTSNVEIEVTPTQIKTNALYDFIKNGSKVPGTVFTKNPKIHVIKPFRAISKIQVETLIYENDEKLAELIGWDLTFDNREYINEKFNLYNEILINQTNNNNCKHLANELNLNLWNNALNSDNSVICEAIEEVKKEFNLE